MRFGVLLFALLALALAGAVAQAHNPAGRTGEHASLDVRGPVAAAPAQAPPARALQSAGGDDRRYALANGCYALRSPSGFVAKAPGGYGATAGSAGAAEAFRMQATALGSYLFYGRDRDFMAAGALNAVAPAGGASPSADWRVAANPDGSFAIALPSAGKALGVAAGRLVLVEPAGASAFTFEPAEGCAVYPEVETSASGTPFKSRTPWGEVKGMIDLHLHMTAFEFLGGRAHCGRPWHPYGAPYALVDCPDHQVGNGCGAVLENVLYGNPCAVTTRSAGPPSRTGRTATR